MDGEQLSVSAAELLRRYLRNIKKHPGDPKYRTIRLGNDKFAAVWAESAARELLTAAGWVADPADPGFITLPLDLAPDAMELLLDQVPTPPPQSQTQTIRPPDSSAAAAPRAAAAHGEAARKEAAIAQERAEVKRKLQQMKAEKERIKRQLEADRLEAAGRQARASQACPIRPGANIARYSDIGVDLNRGGG